MACCAAAARSLAGWYLKSASQMAFTVSGAAEIIADSAEKACGVVTRLTRAKASMSQTRPPSVEDVLRVESSASHDQPFNGSTQPHLCTLCSFGLVERCGRCGNQEILQDGLAREQLSN